MQEKVVGFYTEQSAQIWFWEYGNQVEVIAQKKRDPQGDGSPHLIIQMIIPDEIVDRIYPEGTIMEQSFRECEGKLLLS